MERIGCSLVDTNGSEVQFWGDTPGSYPGAPDVLRLPNGDFVHSLKLGEEAQGYRLVERHLSYGPAEQIQFDGSKVVVTRPVLPSMIDAERDRRIASGAPVTIGGNTFTVQTRDDRDFRNINGLASKGIVLLMASDTTTTVSFRDAHNVSRDLNAQALVSMAEQVAAYVQGIYAKSWALKAMSPIPADYASDGRWL